VASALSELALLLLAVAAGLLSGMVGTGSSLILLPILVHQHGPVSAMPIMTIAALIGNFTRIAIWYRLVDWRAVFAYALPGVPAAIIGARTLLALPAGLVESALGLFLIAMIPARRWLRARNWRLNYRQLAACGALIGFLTGLLVSTGPLSVPAFTLLGLHGGAFLGTEAAGSLALYLGKIGTFAQADALPGWVIGQGLLVGGGLLAGTAIGKPLVLRLPARVHDAMLDTLLLVAGSALLWTAAAPG
jgi:uncharacterized membrane protein YfcA